MVVIRGESHRQHGRSFLLGGLCTFPVSGSDFDPTADWSFVDRRYYKLQNNALFWTLVDMGTDAWYFLLLVGTLFDQGDWDEDDEGFQTRIPVFLHLIISFVANLGVIVLNRQDQSFFPISVVKGVLFLASCILCCIIILLPFSKELWGPYWAPVGFVLGIYNGIKGMTIYAHFIFHNFVVRLGLKEHLTRTQAYANPEACQAIKQVENPIENFYVLKTAQLKRKLLMKQTAQQEEQEQMQNTEEFWTENFYEEANGNDDENEKGDNGENCTEQKNDNQVWTLSDGKDKFLTRSVALDAEKYTIYDVQISL